MTDPLSPGALRPDPAAASPSRRILAQARFDATVMVRNGEQLLLTFILPVVLLVILAKSSVPDLGPGRRIDLVAPGVLALAVLSTAFTGQAIGTGFDRRYGVLRLLGTTPLGRGGLVAGRALAVVAVEVAQVAVLAGVAAGLGWRPRLLGVPAAVLALAAGTWAFVALGLLLAGTARSEAVLAAANLAWVLLLAGGGVVVPTERMSTLGSVARLLPSGALGDAVRQASLHGAVAWGALGVLVVWGGLGTAAALRWFRWD